MSFFDKCLSVFIVLNVIIIGLFEMVFFSEMPFSSNFLFGCFASLMGAIFFGWIYDMFFQKQLPDAEI